MIFALHSIFPGVSIAIAAFYLFVFYSFIHSTQIYWVSIMCNEYIKEKQKIRNMNKSLTSQILHSSGMR